MKQIILSIAIGLLLMPSIASAQTDAPAPRFNYTIVNEPPAAETAPANSLATETQATSEQSVVPVGFVLIGWLVVIGLFSLAAFLIIQKSVRLRKQKK